MAGWEIGQAIAGIADGLFNTGYNVYTDQRDYWRNKHVQEETWRREDSAIQRRVSDAQAAGINPYDAISGGAGASSGQAIVQHSNSLQPGSLMDKFTAIKQNKILDEKLKQERDNTETNRLGQFYQRIMAKNAYIDFLNNYERYAYEHGKYPQVDFYSGRMGFSDIDKRKGYVMSEGYVPGDYNYSENTPFNRMLNANMQNFLNQSDMLRKENLWYNTNEILNAINSGAGSVGNIFGAFGNATGGYRNIQTGRYFRNQNNFYDSYNKNKNPIGFNFSY